MAISADYQVQFTLQNKNYTFDLVQSQNQHAPSFLKITGVKYTVLSNEAQSQAVLNALSGQTFISRQELIGRLSKVPGISAVSVTGKAHKVASTHFASTVGSAHTQKPLVPKLILDIETQAKLAKAITVPKKMIPELALVRFHLIIEELRSLDHGVLAEQLRQDKDKSQKHVVTSCYEALPQLMEVAKTKYPGAALQEKLEHFCAPIEALLKHKPIEVVNKPAQVIAEAAFQRSELSEMRVKAKKDFKAGKPVSSIARGISESLKNFVARLYQEGEKTLGAPPCRYCVVGLGSLGRNETGPYPDYDNFIIMETNSSEARRYFTRLNQYVTDRIVRLGDVKGFHLCDGNLNSPYQKYKHRYSSERELHLGGRQELLTAPDYMKVGLGDISESAPMAGDKALYSEYMALFMKKQPKAVETAAVFNIKRNVTNENSPIIAKKLPEMIHLKEDLFRFPQATISALALHHGIQEKNSILRIEELRKIGIFSAAFAARLTSTIEHLLRFRMQVQFAHGEEFELVSTGNWESYKGHMEKMKLELSKAEAELENEVLKVAQMVPEVQVVLSASSAKLKEVASQLETPKSQNKKWDVQTLEMQRIKQKMFKKVTKACKAKIKALDLEIASSNLKGSPTAQLEKQKQELKQSLDILFNKNGLIAYCRDVLNPKIASNQYARESHSPVPAIEAFTAQDKQLLTNEVLPILRELFSVASTSIKSGTLNPEVFKGLK